MSELRIPDGIRAYDRQGMRLVGMGALERLLRDPDYKIVRQTTLPNGRFVSTVWLGFDHRWWGDGAPLIFETMVFPVKGDFGNIDGERYSTEAEALAGHLDLCRRWAHRPGRRLKKRVLLKKMARARDERRKTQKRMRLWLRHQRGLPPLASRSA